MYPVYQGYLLHVVQQTKCAGGYSGASLLNQLAELTRLFDLISSDDILRQMRWNLFIMTE
jgi:hypothetical protein